MIHYRFNYKAKLKILFQNFRWIIFYLFLLYSYQRNNCFVQYINLFGADTLFFYVGRMSNAQKIEQYDLQPVLIAADNRKNKRVGQ
jgi:hypothetical protein